MKAKILNTHKVGLRSSVILGTSSFLARHEVFGKTTENLVPSWERARTQPDYKYGLRCRYKIVNYLTKIAKVIYGRPLTD